MRHKVVEENTAGEGRDRSEARQFGSKAQTFNHTQSQENLGKLLTIQCFQNRERKRKRKSLNRGKEFALHNQKG